MSTRSVDGVHWADLDGLRAFAILLVLARHSLRPFVPDDAYQSIVTLGPVDLTPFVLNGWIGVDLFFVLSGFLIGRQAWRGDGLLRFWFKRATRILPAYWTCLAVVAIALTVGGAWPSRGTDFLAHIVMLQDYTGSVFVAAFWSLGAEEKFYLLAPLLVLLVARGRGRWLSARSVQAGSLVALWLVPVASRALMAGGLPATVSYTEYFLQYRSPFHLTCESLVVGFAIAWMSKQPRAMFAGRASRESLFYGGAAVVLWWLVPSQILGRIDARTIVVAPALIGLAFGAMVLAVVSGRGSYSALLGHSLWRPIATGSYTIYLTHMMIIPVASAFAMAIPLAAGTATARWLSFLPWYLALTVVSAYVLHRCVERPVLEWRDCYLNSQLPTSNSQPLPIPTAQATPNFTSI